jgi:plastocyanin
MRHVPYVVAGVVCGVLAGCGEPVDPSQSSIVATPTTGLKADGMDSAVLRITLKGASGKPLAGLFVTLSVTPTEGATLSQPADTTNSDGISVGNLRSLVAGTKTVTASVRDVALTQQATIEFGPAELLFASQPTTTSNGETMAPVQVVFRDGAGNPVQSATGTVTLSGTAEVTGQSAVAAVKGLATFSSLRATRAGRERTLIASSPGFRDVTSNPFNVFHAVRVGGTTNTFSPSEVSIQPGDTVRWIVDSGGHTVASGTVSGGIGTADGRFCYPLAQDCANSPLMGVGTTYDVTFNTPSTTYDYYCRPHSTMGMTGKVIVF